MSGHVYFFSNPAMPGLLKIGFTRRPVIERIKKLSSHTGVPSEFNCVALIATDSPENLEKYIHDTLADYHSEKEFYQIDLWNAVAKIAESFDGENIFESNFKSNKVATSRENLLSVLRSNIRKD